MSQDFANYIADELGEFGKIRIKKMFSSYGLYCDDKFFAIVSEGVLYLKTNSDTAQKYKDAGMSPFTPSQEQVLKNYLEVPVDVLENREELIKYTEEAFEI